MYFALFSVLIFLSQNVRLSVVVNLFLLINIVMSQCKMLRIIFMYSYQSKITS